jgi:hypothetical protein
MRCAGICADQDGAGAAEDKALGDNEDLAGLGVDRVPTPGLPLRWLRHVGGLLFWMPKLQEPMGASRVGNEPAAHFPLPVLGRLSRA